MIVSSGCSSNSHKSPLGAVAARNTIGKIKPNKQNNLAIRRVLLSIALRRLHIPPNGWIWNSRLRLQGVFIIAPQCFLLYQFRIQKTVSYPLGKYALRLKQLHNAARTAPRAEPPQKNDSHLKSIRGFYFTRINLKKRCAESPGPLVIVIVPSVPPIIPPNGVHAGSVRSSLYSS